MHGNATFKTWNMSAYSTARAACLFSGAVTQPASVALTAWLLVPFRARSDRTHEMVMHQRVHHHRLHEHVNVYSKWLKLGYIYTGLYTCNARFLLSLRARAVEESGTFSDFFTLGAVCISARSCFSTVL